jgi:hypothetical protein
MKLLLASDDKRLARFGMQNVLEGKSLCADNNGGISRCARLAAFTPVQNGKGKDVPVNSGGRAV